MDFFAYHIEIYFDLWTNLTKEFILVSVKQVKKKKFEQKAVDRIDFLSSYVNVFYESSIKTSSKKIR